MSVPDSAAGHCQPTTLPKTLDTHRQVWPSLLWDNCSFLLSPGAHKDLLFPPRVCFPRSSQSFCWILRLGIHLWAIELLQLCENFFGKAVLQFVGHLLCSSIGRLMATSYTVPSWSATARAPVPQQVTANLILCTRQTLKGRSGSVTVGATAPFPQD